MIKINDLQMNQLSDTQIKQIRELEEICHKNEGLKKNVYLSTEINFDQKIDCFYLLYDGEKLVSFLVLFIPMQSEAELSAYTLPECRNKGYFHILFQKAAAEVKKYGIAKILFVHEPAGQSAAQVLNAYRTTLSHSEYSLAYDRTSFVKLDTQLRLEPAFTKDIPEMSALNVVLFGDSYEESASILTKSMESAEIKVYSAFLADRLIGLCNVNITDGIATIYGIGISPDHQNKGYGRQMLNLLLEKLLQSSIGEIMLEVSSTNAAAYHLYLTSGFKARTQYDYDAYFLQKQ